jgi:DNA-binding response OmpR family regulator
MEAEARDAKRRTLLVVDDDPSITKLVRRNLEGPDTQVIEATTGLDGLRMLQEAKVDLVLLDLRLPDFNGWGILSLLRLTESLSHIPVIVLSAEQANPPLPGWLGPDDFIQKPFEMRDLIARVRRMVE